MFATKSKIIFLMALLLLPCRGPAAFAAAGDSVINGWQAEIADYAHAPSFLLAVDKKEQLLRIYERRSPLVQAAEFICTTGQNEGDKLVRGDMKTPEGIYFVVSHINSGLDYALYGNEAYPLNYPNPVDRLRRKSGSGIWLHGKGVPLIPLDSNGCVGMRNQDLATFEPVHFIGQPVALALQITAPREKNSDKEAAALELASLVGDWISAWSDKSERFFDFYDQEAYSLAQGQPFSRFKAHKLALFGSLPWIKTTAKDLQILEGPGYWVTWFNQDYATTGLQSRGTRRLYWQKDAGGRMRIVGMEWIKDLRSPFIYADAGYQTPTAILSDAAQPSPLPAAPLPQSEPSASAPQTILIETAAVPSPTAPSQPVLNSGVLELIQEWHEAWQNRDLPIYLACYAENAVQDERRGVQAIMEHKRRIWAKTGELRIELRDIVLEASDYGPRVRMRQDYRDSKGYADQGEKILYLEFEHIWRITREEWTPLR
ncbi:MAG: L,D-transpeptidase family protein [Desulfovibrionaceae bacterium]|nr:L,D-transpeptidase family protein [Desulfovibrionaceae bacterium]